MHGREDRPRYLRVHTPCSWIRFDVESIPYRPGPRDIKPYKSGNTAENMFPLYVHICVYCICDRQLYNYDVDDNLNAKTQCIRGSQPFQSCNL